MHIRAFYNLIDKLPYNNSFRFKSGLLCSYSFLKQIKGKKLTAKFVLKFYLRRYYRITIPLILTMLFTVGLNKYFHSGFINRLLYLIIYIEH